jgi:hypothetical protein
LLRRFTIFSMSKVIYLRKYGSGNANTPQTLAPTIVNHDTLQVVRQQAVKAVRNGETADSVSKTMGLNIRTVFP